MHLKVPCLAHHTTHRAIGVLFRPILIYAETHRRLPIGTGLPHYTPLCQGRSFLPWMRTKQLRLFPLSWQNVQAKPRTLYCAPESVTQRNRNGIPT